MAVDVARSDRKEKAARGRRAASIFTTREFVRLPRRRTRASLSGPRAQDVAVGDAQSEQAGEGHQNQREGPRAVSIRPVSSTSSESAGLHRRPKIPALVARPIVTRRTIRSIAITPPREG